jgi:hypothetical protein
MAKKLMLEWKWEVDFKLAGISSALKEYQLAWQINNLFNWELMKGDDLTGLKKSDKFAVYFYDDEMDKRKIHLISNLNKGKYFLTDLKQADFLLRIEGSPSKKEWNDWLKELKKIDGVQTVFSIDVNKIKNADMLILE